MADSVLLAVPGDGKLPNWYDGPITIWAIVDGKGEVFVFGSRYARNVMLERWEETLKQFAPYRAIELVQKPRET